MNILVCGGAGYVGSHMLKALDAAGHDSVVLDNFSTGHRAAVRGRACAAVDLLDETGLDAVFRAHAFDAVMHFCARSLVSESVSEPYAYYRNNVTGTLNLLAAMQRHGVNRLVFSSSCAIFGEPETERLAENHPTRPLNPYGASKRMVEQILADAHRAYGLRSVSLRYFNAAGASPDGDIGEAHNPETHLIPNVLRAALGKGGPLKVYGSDYATPDGTCVRDYVHVDDLSAAHLLALQQLEHRDAPLAYNLGSEQGYSVLQVIESARRVSGHHVPFERAPRRPGDAPTLVADSSLARRELGWVPGYRELDSIIETAWRWHRAPRY